MTKELREHLTNVANRMEDIRIDGLFGCEYTEDIESAHHFLIGMAMLEAAIRSVKLAALQLPNDTDEGEDTP